MVRLRCFFQGIVLFAILLLLNGQALAAGIADLSLVPNIASYTVGDEIQLDLVIDREYDYFKVGEFDIELEFDSELLQVESLTSGGALGTGHDVVTNFDNYGNTISLSENTSLTHSELTQNDPFTLATITFTALQEGAGDVAFVSAQLTDVRHLHPFETRTADATIEVNAVPVPAAAWLLGSGLFGMLFVRRKK